MRSIYKNLDKKFRCKNSDSVQVVKMKLEITGGRKEISRAGVL